MNVGHKRWFTLMKKCDYARVVIKLLRDLSIGRVFMDGKISKSHDSSCVGENNSEPSPYIKERGIMTLGTSSCLQ